MNKDELIRQLEEGVESLEDFPLSELIEQGLLKDREASLKFIKGRLENRFADRFEIGEHSRQFLEASGLTKGHLTQVIGHFELKTRKTQLTLDREAEHKRAYERKLKALKATCDVIRGYGSTSEISEESGVSYATIATLLRKFRKEGLLDLKSLKEMPTETRRVLALKIERQHEEEYLRQHLKNIGE